MSLILHTDVTSVRLYQDLILAGIGSSLNIYDKATSQLLQRVLCLNGQKIYGIAPFRNRLLIFGGKQFSVLKIEETEGRRSVKEFGPVVCNDWLHSAVWVDQEQVALLTAHNVVESWTLPLPALQSRVTHEDNSILYSGLLVPIHQEVLVLAGTVFSQVIVHHQGETLQRLDGHKGVIFSISCDQIQGIIVTTSDDRSVRIWSPNHNHSLTKLEHWKNTSFTCKYELYGHAARVMRSCITKNSVISVGEDSAICFWNNGALTKKLSSHQGGCIWSVDADDDSLVTGGGDASVIIHPLSLADEYEVDTLNINIDSPKKIFFTARRNLILLNENNLLVYYNNEENTTTQYKLDHESTYKVAGMSVCKQMVAVADMTGKLDVFIENCKETAGLIKIVDTKVDIGKVLSLHWGDNRSIILCADSGIIHVLESNNLQIEHGAIFNLPPCKERWLTAAAVDKNVHVIGDRCGNIHVFVKGKRDPLKTFSKVHGRYGPTSIIIKEDVITSTGRNGAIKYFSKKGDSVRYMSSKDLEFQWIEKFLDKNENIVCGFQERVFTVYNLRTNSKVIELSCGGGHRSWDAVRYIEKINGKYEEIIKFTYLKNSEINMATFVLSKMVSRNIKNGSHSKEINCLKIITVNETVLSLSGGEDTTLRLTTVDPYEDKTVFKQLSNIKTVKTYFLDRNSVLVITGGGRAQICVKLITVTDDLRIKSHEIINYMIKGIDKVRKNNQDWRNSCIDFDPETRIVDLDLTKIGTSFCILAGCSDGFLRVFNLDNYLDNAKFDLIHEMKYHKTCILKTHILTYLTYNILITCTTTGDVAFWNLRDLTTNLPDVTTNLQDLTKNLQEPFYVMKTNKSGINCITTTSSENKLIIATGGDDNAIHIILLTLKDQDNLASIDIINRLTLDKYHSSQITGLLFCEQYFISASIDQRVTTFKWSCEEEVKCEFVKQTYSDVADIQGMELVSNTSTSIIVCVFGKGIEVIRIETTDTWKAMPTYAMSQVKVEAVTEPVWLGEGPHWDSSVQALYFVSIFDLTIHKYVPSTGVHTRSKLDGMPTFIIPIEGKANHFAVGVNRKVLEVYWDGGEQTAKVIRTVAEVDHENPNNRFNDAKADPRGRLFAGTMGHEYEPGKFHLKKGALYRIDGVDQVKKLADNIDISNGLCWDVSEKAFYFADSFEYTIRRYDYDIETGDISNPRNVFAYAEHGLAGIVDGMTIDTDGNLWVANFDGYQVLKINPRTGDLLQKVPIPALQTTSATWGGAALDELFVTSAAMDRGEAQPAPRGSTFRVVGLGARGHDNVNVKFH